jgi:Ca2+-binding EF-hand superfamily protein
MSGRRIVCVSVALLLVSASAKAAQKATTPATDKNSVATQNVKQLLFLMDADKNGKISKQEWMNFMSAEFDRLDKDKSGELDPKELGASRFTVRHIAPATQGK